MSTGLYTPQQNPQYPGQQYPGQQYPGQQYPPVPQLAAPPRGGSNWILSLLLIGGGVLLIGCVLIVGAVWYAVSSIEAGSSASAARASWRWSKNRTFRPPEKTEVIAQIDRVVAAYKADEIGSEDLERLLTGLDDSFLMTYISYYGIQEYLLERFRRAARGAGSTQTGLAAGRPRNVHRQDHAGRVRGIAAFRRCVRAGRRGRPTRNDVLHKWHA
jgi:hypothetical protein